MTSTPGPWYIAGPLAGLVIVWLRASLNSPLGAVGGYVDLIRNPSAPTRWGVSVYLLFGIVLGGAVFTVASGAWPSAATFGAADPFLPENPFLRAAALSIAGLFIGFGARMAGGCTSGHGLCGTSLGSPASFVATTTFFATGVLFAHLLFWMSGGVR